MITTRIFARLRREQDGAAVIEFAMLAPVLLAMCIGILAIGVQMQNYSAMRSLASDLNRYTVVEYQKSNEMTITDIRNVATSLAVNPLYGLQGDRLDVEVAEVASPVSGAKKISLTLSYSPFISFYGMDALTLTHQQNIYVPASS